MDSFGDVVREFLKQQRNAAVCNAVSLGEGFRKEGMTHSQIEEMLCANGFDCEIVQEALEEISPNEE